MPIKITTWKPIKNLQKCFGFLRLITNRGILISASINTCARTPQWHSVGGTEYQCLCLISSASSCMWAPPLLEGEKKPNSNNKPHFQSGIYRILWTLGFTSWSASATEFMLQIYSDSYPNDYLVVDWIFFFFLIFPVVYSSTDENLGSYRNLGQETNILLHHVSS